MSRFRTPFLRCLPCVSSPSSPLCPVKNAPAIRALTPANASFATPTVPKALKQYALDAPLRAALIPACECWNTPPWVLLELLTQSHFRLPPCRAVELLKWTKQWVQQTVEGNETERMDKMIPKIHALYRNLLHRHTFSRGVVLTYLKVLKSVGDTAGLELVFTKTAAPQGQHSPSVVAVSAALLEDPVFYRTLFLALERTVSCSPLSGTFLEDSFSVFQHRNEILHNSLVVAAYIRLLCAVHERGKALEWLDWHLEVLGGDISDPVVCELFPEKNWRRILPKHAFAALGWAETASEVGEIVQVLCGPDQGGKDPYGVYLRALGRLAYLSTPEKPLVKEATHLLSDWLRHTKERGNNRGNAFGADHYDAYVKILCDGDKIETAWKLLQKAQALEIEIYPTTLGEILGCVSGESTLGRVAWKMLYVKYWEKKEWANLHACYSRMVKRYLQRNPTENAVNALQYQQKEIERLHQERKAEQPINADNENLEATDAMERNRMQSFDEKDEKRVGSTPDRLGISNTTSTDPLIAVDLAFADTVYETIDRETNPEVAQSLFLYLTQTFPEFDEIIVNTVCSNVSPRDPASCCYALNPSYLLLSQFTDVKRILQDFSSRIYILDASAVEHFTRVDQWLNNLANKTEETNKSCLLYIPFVALREACLTLQQTVQSSDAVHIRDSITLLLRCIQHDFKIEVQTSKSCVANNRVVRLLHPTEELLFRSYGTTRTQTDENHLEKKENLFSLLLPNRSLSDDDDRVMLIAQVCTLCHLQLFSHTEEKHKMDSPSLLTLDDKLADKATQSNLRVFLLQPDTEYTTEEGSNRGEATNAENGIDLEILNAGSSARDINSRLQSLLPQQVNRTTTDGEEGSVSISNFSSPTDIPAHVPRRGKLNQRGKERVKAQPSSDTSSSEKQKVRKPVDERIRRDLRNHGKIIEEAKSRTLRMRARRRIYTNYPFWKLPGSKINIRDPRNKPYLDEYYQLLGKRTLPRVPNVSERGE